MDDHLRKVSIREVSEILQKHFLWLQDNPEGGRADLSWCDLRLMNLSFTVLVGADFRNSDLSRANFLCSNMQFADLRGAKLSDSCFKGADLSFGVLEDVSINHSDFSLARLHYTNFRRVEGREACFDHADFSHAFMIEVNLQGASLLDCCFVNTLQMFVDFRNTKPHGADYTDVFSIGCKY